jgi:RNA polymerase sigma-32 factor
LRHALLLEAMDALNPREREILTERRLAEVPVTLEDLSQRHDVSRERIRQIEVRAFEKLQARMRFWRAKKGWLFLSAKREMPLRGQEGCSGLPAPKAWARA